MDPLLILNLLDRFLDLAGRIGNTEELEEYIELRKDVRKARVDVANSLGSATAPQNVDVPPSFTFGTPPSLDSVDEVPQQQDSEDETNSSQE